MKLLCLCSALDLSYRYGCTPAWWQFFKGLHELGHDVIAIPYQGPAIETPWWRTYPNPCQYEGEAFSKVKKLLGRGASMSMKEGFGAQVTRTLIESWVRPRWDGSLRQVFFRERDIDAVIVFSIPVNHFAGIPESLRKNHGLPVFYYDGDVPASLPRFGGYASGFSIYEDASLAEYEGVLCNSEGGAEDLRALGAKRVEVVHWGVDPELFSPLEIEPQRDVFFYGYGAEYREEWIENLLVAPSRALPDYRFEVGGGDFGGPMGNVRRLGAVHPSQLRAYCCSSKINLNISRRAHASVRASSSTRLFELAAMGCCIVSNPCAGMERWFEPDKEVLVAGSDSEALRLYETLLPDEDRRFALGQAARRRVLENHTHRHRARQIAEFVKGVK